LVNRHWDSIELLALELFQRGTLTGDEIRALVADLITVADAEVHAGSPGAGP
jgi:hypothetical protein